MLRRAASIIAPLAIGTVLLLLANSRPHGEAQSAAVGACGLLVALFVFSLARVGTEQRYMLALAALGVTSFAMANLDLSSALTPLGWCGTGRAMQGQMVAAFGFFLLAVGVVAVGIIKERKFFPTLLRYGAWISVVLATYVAARALAICQRPSAARYWKSQQELGPLPLQLDGHAVLLQRAHDRPLIDYNCDVVVDGTPSGSIYVSVIPEVGDCPRATATGLGDIVVVRSGHQEVPVRLGKPGPRTISTADLAGKIAAPAPWTLLGVLGGVLGIFVVVFAERKRRGFLALGTPHEAIADATGLLHLPGFAPMPSPPGTRAAEGPVTIWLALVESATYRAADTAAIVRAAEGTLDEVLAKQARYVCNLHISAILATTLTSGPLWAAHLHGIL